MIILLQQTKKSNKKQQKNANLAKAVLTHNTAFTERHSSVIALGMGSKLFSIFG